MKFTKLLTVLFLAGAAMVFSDVSWAHGGHYYGRSRIGVGIAVGGPIWPWYYPPTYYYPPSYYYPPVVTVPASPPVYIEQATEAPPPQSYWYYCNSSKTYYPYTQQCPEEWQRVVPQPPR